MNSYCELPAPDGEEPEVIGAIGVSAAQIRLLEIDARSAIT